MNKDTIKSKRDKPNINKGVRPYMARDWKKIRNPYGAIMEKDGLKKFLEHYGISYKTWRRELARGSDNTAIVLDVTSRERRWIYPDYDWEKAQAVADKLAENKGKLVIFTNKMADVFCKLIKEEKLSPTVARIRLMALFPDRRIPCVKSLYNYINKGLLDVKRGETPYHPGVKKPPREKSHPAKVKPNRNKIEDRPIEANNRIELGHYEMDTIVSCKGGSGGLLVLIDRLSRRVIIEKIRKVNQSEVRRALRHMIHDGKLTNAISVTTDNGCEFLDQDALQKILKCKVYYTRAYAAWEKGQVENVNKLIRRWFPKRTNFKKVFSNEISIVAERINNMERMIINGKSPYDFEKTFNEIAIARV